MRMLRHPANPILTAAAIPYPATLVFNAGVCRYQGRYVNDTIYYGAADTVECLATASVDDLLAACKPFSRG